MASKSEVAKTALDRIGQLYGILRGIAELGLDSPSATQRRQQQAKPLLAALHAWLLAQRQVLSDGTASAKAFDCTLRRWPALVRYADNAQLPTDNNHIENQMRPWALGSKNWLFAGSPQAGGRAADIMGLIQTARMNGIKPLSYLTDLLKRSPRSQIAALRSCCLRGGRPPAQPVMPHQPDKSNGEFGARVVGAGRLRTILRPPGIHSESGRAGV